MGVNDNYIPSKHYRDKDLTPQQIQFCHAFIAEGIGGIAARIAGYKNPSKAASYLLSTKRIKRYLDRHLPDKVNCSITFESKLNALDILMDKAITQNIREDKVNVPLLDRGLKAIEIANTMQGHNAPTQSQSVTVNVKATQDKMLEAKKAYEEY